MSQPTPDRSFRLQNWQIVLAVGVVLALVVAVAVLASGRGDGTVVSDGPTTTGSADPSTTIVFEAPPPQDAGTTSSSTTEATPSSTETTGPDGSVPASSTTSTSDVPTTTTPTATTSTTTTTTTPPRPANPGPVVETTAGGHQQMAAAILSARAQWDAESHPNGYVYRTRLVCFCPYGDNEIVVGPTGAVESQRTIEGDPEFDPETVDDLFDRLQDAVDANAAMIRASFDVEGGYPVEFFIDYDEQTADEEIGREVDWVAPR